MNSSRSRLLISFAVSALFMFGCRQSVRAQEFDYTVVNTRMNVAENEIHFVTDLPLTVDDTASPADRAGMESYYRQFLQIHHQGERCETSIRDLESSPEGNTAQINGSYHCPQPITALDNLTIESTLFRNIFEHFDHFITVRRGEESREFTFSSVGGIPDPWAQNTGEPASPATTTAQSAQTAAPSLLRFIIPSGILIISMIWLVRRLGLGNK